MSNRRFQHALDLMAYGRQAELRVSRLILNIIIVSIIIAVAIIPARLADWIA
jgi:subtilase family serine protease